MHTPTRKLRSYAHPAPKLSGPYARAYVHQDVVITFLTPRTPSIALLREARRAVQPTPSATSLHRPSHRRPTRRPRHEALHDRASRRGHAPLLARRAMAAPTARRMASRAHVSSRACRLDIRRPEPSTQWPGRARNGPGAHITPGAPVSTRQTPRGLGSTALGRSAICRRDG